MTSSSRIQVKIYAANRVEVADDVVEREAPGPEARLTDAVRRALIGCKLLEQDPALKGLSFRTDEVLVKLPDRLRAPATDAGYGAFQNELGSLVAKVYAGATATIGRVGGPREVLGARVKVGPGVSVSELLARLS